MYTAASQKGRRPLYRRGAQGMGDAGVSSLLVAQEIYALEVCTGANIFRDEGVHSLPVKHKAKSSVYLQDTSTGTQRVTVE